MRRALAQRVVAAIGNHLVVLSMFATALGALTLACNTQPSTPSEPTTEPPPDPYATCRDYLAGTWTYGSNFQIRYERDSGAGIVQWNNTHTVVASAFLDCSPDAARLIADGRTIEIQFLPPDRIEVTSTGFGYATLRRSPEP